ncbi:MAG: hypothetical protein LBP59_17190 [Planctomycetaceae bacterium]|nr:hypothetical protein [Planctomycetaceae bacterium]
MDQKNDPQITQIRKIIKPFTREFAFTFACLIFGRHALTASKNFLCGLCVLCG